MVELTRRTLLAGGAVALGSTAAAAAVLAPRAFPARAEPTAAPAPSPTPTVAPVPHAPVARLGQPLLLASLAPRTSGAVMQQVERVATGELFMTQSRDGGGP